MHLSFVCAAFRHLLDSKQERVVHQALTKQERDIFPDCIFYNNPVGGCQLGKSFVLLGVLEEIDILKRCRCLDFTLDFTIYDAALQIEDVLQVLSIFGSEYVLHQHKMHRGSLSHLNCKDAKDLC